MHRGADLLVVDVRNLKRKGWSDGGVAIDTALPESCVIESHVSLSQVRPG